MADVNDQFSEDEDKLDTEMIEAVSSFSFLLCRTSSVTTDQHTPVVQSERPWRCPRCERLPAAPTRRHHQEDHDHRH